MVLQNVNEAVMEVFEVTGFSDILPHRMSVRSGAQRKKERMSGRK